MTGGFDEGFRQAGYSVAWAVEIDPHCQAVLHHHFPGAVVLSDVKTVNGADLEPVDIITFGSPCQGLSVAGKRAGFADAEVSGLFFHATRIITEMREATNGQFPRFAVWENVPGATSSAHGNDFGAALNALAESGAVDLAWRIINAEHWVPQRRRRVFVLALYPPAADGRAGIGRAAEILSVSEGVLRDTAKGRKAGEDLAGTLGGGSGSRGWSSDTDRMSFVPEVTRLGFHENLSATVTVDTIAKALRSGASKSYQGIIEPLKAQSGGTGKGDGAPLVMAFSENQRAEVVTSNIAHQITGGVGKPGQGYPAIVFTERTRADGRNMETQEDISYALTNPGAGGRTNSRQVQVRAQVRRLTPLECTRLQGFPDDWLDGLGLADSTKYRMLGNAVCTKVAEWIGRRLKQLTLEG